MNTKNFRGALTEKITWPVDFVVKNGLALFDETRAGAYIDEAPIFDEADDDVEFFRSKFRLMSEERR